MGAKIGLRGPQDDSPSFGRIAGWRDSMVVLTPLGRGKRRPYGPKAASAVGYQQSGPGFQKYDFCSALNRPRLFVFNELRSILSVFEFRSKILERPSRLFCPKIGLRHLFSRSYVILCLFFVAGRGDGLRVGGSGPGVARGEHSL